MSAALESFLARAEGDGNLLALTAKFGVVVNGNKNWLALGPVQIQPSEIAKLAIVLWAAHVYAQKDRRLGSLHQVMVPVVPVLLGITLLVIIGRDLGILRDRITDLRDVDDPLAIVTE